MAIRTHPTPRLLLWEVGANQGDCSTLADNSRPGRKFRHELRPGNFAVHMLTSWGRTSQQQRLGSAEPDTCCVTFQHPWKWLNVVKEDVGRAQVQPN